MEVKRLFYIPYYQNEKFPQQEAFADKVLGEWVKVSTQEQTQYANSVNRELIKIIIHTR